MARLNTALQNAIAFARIAIRYGIDPADLAAMIAFAKAAKAAYEREDGPTNVKCIDEADKIAAAYGCTLDWPGLWPTISKPGAGETLLPVL